MGGHQKAMRQNSYGIEIDQRCINFIQYLEKRYNVDIKRTVDFVEIRNKWISEGSPMPTPANVPQKASKSLRRGNVQKIVGWDYKKNPLKWDDLI